MSKLVRTLITATAAALVVGMLTPPPVAQAETTAAPAADRFPGIDDDLDRVLADRTAAAATIGGPAALQPLVKLDASVSEVTASPCPAGAKMCAKVATKAAGGATTAATGGWPAKCSANQYDTTPSWLGVTRKSGCDHEANGIVVYDVETKRLAGTSDFHMGLTAQAVAGGAGWTTTAFLAMWAYTGYGRPSLVTARVSAVPTGATGGVTSWTTTSKTDVWRGNGWVSAPTIASGETVAGVGGAWVVTFSNPRWSNTVTWVLRAFRSRCDRYYATAGCVFNKVPGIAIFSTSTAPQYAKHVAGAIRSGLPGRLGSASYLSRITSKTSISKNRTKACPARLKRPKGGYSCDEYPFASTNQGASTSKAVKARSQSWCRMPDPARKGKTGWSRCFIKATDNSVGGAYLGAFYRLERMLKGDRFQVGFIP